MQEACFICRGPEGASAVMKMTSGAQDAMWAAVERADAAQYHATLSALHVVPSERHSTSPAVPVRLIVRSNKGKVYAKSICEPSPVAVLLIPSDLLPCPPQNQSCQHGRTHT